MPTTAARPPASLVRAFYDELSREGPGLERRVFLRRVAASAAGPPSTDDPPHRPLNRVVATGDGVALAVRVVGQCADVRGETSGAEPEPHEQPATPVLAGRAAARELARRGRRRLGSLRRGR